MSSVRLLACTLIVALTMWNVADAATKSRKLFWFPNNDFDNQANWEGKALDVDEWASLSFPQSVAEFNGGQGATVMLKPRNDPWKVSAIDFGNRINFDLQSGTVMELGTITDKVVPRSWRAKTDSETDFKCSDNWRDAEGDAVKDPPCWLDTAVFPAASATMVVVPPHTYVETLQLGANTFTSRNEDDFPSVADTSQWAGEVPRMTAADCRSQFNADDAEPCRRYCTDSCAKSDGKSALEVAKDKAAVAKQEQAFIDSVANVFEDAVDIAAKAAKEALETPRDVPVLAAVPTPVDQEAVKECAPGSEQEPKCRAAESMRQAADSEVTGDGRVSVRLQVFQKARGRRDVNGTDAALAGAGTVTEYLSLVDGSEAVQKQFSDAVAAAVMEQLPGYMTFYRLGMHIVEGSLRVEVEAATGEMVVSFKPQMSAEDKFMRLYSLQLLAEAVTPALVCISGDAMAALPSTRFLLGACPDSAAVRTEMKRFGAPAAQTVRTELSLTGAFELLAPEIDRAGSWRWASNPHLTLDNYKAETMVDDRAGFNRRFSDNLLDYFLATVHSADFHYRGPAVPGRDRPLDPAHVDLQVSLVVPQAVWDYGSQMFARAEMTKWTNVAASRAVIFVLQQDVAEDLKQLEEQVASLEASEAGTTAGAPEQDGESGKAAGIPLAVIIGAAVGLVLVIVAIIVVVVVRRRPAKEAAADKTTNAVRQVVSFENPMYDDPNQGFDYEAHIEEDLEGLYDSPAFNHHGVGAPVENPLYKSRESLAGEAEYMEAGFAGNSGFAVEDTPGYLDVGDYALPQQRVAEPTVKHRGPELAELYGFKEEEEEDGYLDVGDMVNALPSFDLPEDE